MNAIGIITQTQDIFSDKLLELFQSKIEYMEHELRQFYRNTTEATIHIRGYEQDGKLLTEVSVSCLCPDFMQQLTTFVQPYNMTQTQSLA